MIRFENVSKNFGSRQLFANLTFTLGRRERCALLGRNGSGKTTLLKMIAGLDSCDSGSIVLPKNYKVGIVSQHAVWSGSTPLEEAITALTDPQEEWKAKKVLFNLGFDNDLLQAPIATLSGGYCLRLQLAKLLLSEPDLLLLDEPTNYLDIKTIRWLCEFLRKWPNEIIAISHDRDFLDAISTHTIGIHRQKLVRVEGGTAKYFEYILQQEEQHEKLVERTEKQRAHLQKFVDRFGAKASKATQAQSKQKQMDKLPQLEALTAIYALNFNFREKPTAAAQLIRVESCSFQYDQKPNLFEDLTFSLRPGSRLCFAGRNGKGKSTLLRILKGELQPLSGTIHYHPSCSIGYFGQTNIDRLDPKKTIEEELLASAPDLSFEQMKKIAGVMMFTQDETKKRIGVLSGGEKSRVLLAKILASPVNVVLLDEPTNHLDIESIEALLEAIEAFNGAVCLVTHSELLLDRIAQELIIFEDEAVYHYLDGYRSFLNVKGWSDATKETSAPTKGTSTVGLSTAESSKKRLSPSTLKRKIEQVEAAICAAEIKKEEAEKNLSQEKVYQDKEAVKHWTNVQLELEEKLTALFCELEALYLEQMTL